jgi:CDP-paratose 2-epimerase
MKNYLITGGAGFIGSNFANFLSQEKNNVTIIDNFSRPGTEKNKEWLLSNFPDIKIIKADIRNSQKILSEQMELHDVVFHLAGQVAVTTSVANPREDFEINALGTFNILEAIRQSKRKPIMIYASTNKVYGGMENIKIIEKNGKYQYENIANGIGEDRSLDFHSPYGCSKGCGDQYVRDYARIYGLETVVLRQSCIYGERQFGVEDQGWLAWFIIASTLDKPITIYGDGKQVRDVLYIKDLYRAWKLAEEKIKKTSGQIYNVGGGPNNTLSLLELISSLKKLSKKDIKINFSDWRPGDQPVYISNIEKSEKEFGWKPEISAIQGIEILYRWVEDNKNLFME